MCSGNMDVITVRAWTLGPMAWGHGRYYGSGLDARSNSICSGNMDVSNILTPNFGLATCSSGGNVFARSARRIWPKRQHHMARTMSLRHNVRSSLRA